ncbi:MAG: hypothetical protein JNL67_22710 [Planctomycetaceae bacterium]|nr:hypothetical protein [Planctomycetaceae bacterium]
MDGFSSTRMYSMVPLLVLVGGFWFLTTKTELDKPLITAAYFGLLIIYVVICTVLNQRKLIVLDMPVPYQRMFMTAQAVSLVGFAWFFYTVF